MFKYIPSLTESKGAVAQWDDGTIVGGIQDLMWIEDHRGDVESDMSVLHRVDDIEDMVATRLVTLVHRLAHYQGAVRHWATLNQPPEPDYQPAQAQALSDVARGSSDVMAIDPVWGQLGSYSKAPAL